LLQGQLPRSENYCDRTFFSVFRANRYARPVDGLRRAAPGALPMVALRFSRIFPRRKSIRQMDTCLLPTAN